MTLLISKHFDMLFWHIVGSFKLISQVWCRFKSHLIYTFLRTAMLIMCQDYKIILLLQGLIIEYLGENYFFFIQDLFYYIVKIFCIWILKADFIMYIVVRWAIWPMGLSFGEFIEWCPRFLVTDFKYFVITIWIFLY